MTEPALAMLAGGVTMRPPSRHRWDGTDLLASRSCGAGCSSLAHSDWQSLRPAEIRATRCLSKTVPARRSWCTSSARIRPATTVSSCSLERRTSYWFRPRDENDKQETKVRAGNSAGSLVFCRAYSYERAKDNFRWTIRITQGITECS